MSPFEQTSTDRRTLFNTTMIDIDKFPCGGASTIFKGLGETEGAGAAVVDTALQRLRLQADEATLSADPARVHGMGYPARNRVDGLGAEFDGARSFVACATGRLG